MFVRVTPNARVNCIEGLWRGPGGEERLALKVAAPPDKGRANKAVIDLLAGALALPKSRLTLDAGEKDRLKTVAVAGDWREIAAALAAIVAAPEKAAEKGGAG
ncbi:MAG: DUF167 domain-containing protein [Parvularculaceae bacterium]